MKNGDLAPSLGGKTPAEIARVAEGILDAYRRGGYSLGPLDKAAITLIIQCQKERRPLGEDQTRAINRIVRDYEQHLIVRAGKIP